MKRTSEQAGLEPSGSEPKKIKDETSGPPPGGEQSDKTRMNIAIQCALYSAEVLSAPHNFSNHTITFSVTGEYD